MPAAELPAELHLREHRDWKTLTVLDDVLTRLAGRGVFVMLDMHTLHSDANQPLWCDAAVCNSSNEQPMYAVLGLEPSR